MLTLPHCPSADMRTGKHARTHARTHATHPLGFSLPPSRPLPRLPPATHGTSILHHRHHWLQGAAARPGSAGRTRPAAPHSLQKPCPRAAHGPRRELTALSRAQPHADRDSHGHYQQPTQRHASCRPAAARRRVTAAPGHSAVRLGQSAVQVFACLDGRGARLFRTNGLTEDLPYKKNKQKEA